MTKKVRANNASVPVTPRIVSAPISARSYMTRKSPGTQNEWNIGRSFQYSTEYEYDDAYGPNHHEECQSICRCRSITHVRIKSVDLTSMAESILHERPKSLVIDKELKPFFEYAVNRIVTHSGAADVNLWKAHVQRGYYGEEVDAVTVGDGPAQRIIEGLTRLVSELTVPNAVQTALVSEYGYLLDGLDMLDWEMVSIRPDEISLPTLGHYTRTDANIVEEYKRTRDRWKHPVAVVVKSENRYRLIDGRHRYLANKDRKKIPVLFGFDV